jgi:hypothetical protein
MRAMAIDEKNFNNKISQDQIKIEIDLTNELEGLSREQKKELKEQIGQIAFDSVITDTGNARSSVSGQKFKALSKEYKRIKRSLGKSGIPDLDLTSSMLGDLRVTNTSKGVALEIKRKNEKKKAFNHITGDTLPPRPFLPNEGEAFRSGIMKQINAAIREAKDELEG